MIQQKAKWYKETDEIIPIETKPNLIELDEPNKKLESSGTDEKGDWILINFVHGKSTFYDYEVKDVEDNGIKQQKVTTKTIKEEEWDQTEADKQCETTLNQCSNVAVEESTSRNSQSTSSGLPQRISIMGRKIWSAITECLSSDA